MNTEMCFPGIKGNDALRARLARDIISGSGLAHAYVIEGRPGQRQENDGKKHRRRTLLRACGKRIAAPVR